MISCPLHNICSNLTISILVYYNAPGSIGPRVVPRNQAAQVGGQVQFVCNSDAAVVWRFEEGRLPHNVVEFHDSESEVYTIIISSIQFSNGGDYECIGEDHHLGYGFYDTGVLTVKRKIPLGDCNLNT